MNIGELIRILRQLNQDLSKIAKILTVISKQTEDINGKLDLSYKQLRLIEAVVPRVKKNGGWIEGLEAWLRTYQTDLNNRSQSRTKSFAKELDGLMSDELGRLHKWGDGFTVSVFALEILTDKSRTRVWYGPKQTALGELSMAPTEVAEKLGQIHKTLGSGLSAKDFANVLRKAYSRISNLSRPSWVQLSEILPEVAFLLQPHTFRTTPKREYFRNYLQSDLSYDLYRLRSSDQPKGFRLQTATLAKTKSKSGSLWIPSRNDIDGGEHYSEIRFIEDNK